MHKWLEKRPGESVDWREGGRTRERGGTRGRRRRGGCQQCVEGAVEEWRKLWKGERGSGGEGGGDLQEGKEAGEWGENEVVNAQAE